VLNYNTSIEHLATTTLELLTQQFGWRYKLKDNPKRAYTGPCPVGQHEHDDSQPTFAVAADKQRFKCFKCDLHGYGPKAMLKALGQPLSRRVPLPQLPQPKPKKAKRLQGCTLEALAQAKKLDIDLLKALGWEDSTYPGTSISAIRIPVHNNDGSLHAYRYRVNLEGNPKYLWEKGTTALPYGLRDFRWLAEQRGYCLLVEGETDTATLHRAGFPALGIPGINTWKTEWGHYLATWPRPEQIKPYVWVEPGKPNAQGKTAGQIFYQHVSRSFSRIWLIHAPPGIKDPNELWQLSPSLDAFQRAMQRLIDGAIPYSAPAEDHPERAAKPDGPDIDIPESDTHVPLRGNREITTLPQRDKANPRERDNLWQAVKEAMPYPTGVKPRLRSRAAYSAKTMKAGVFNFLSRTWRNPVNAMLKRRVIASNLLRRIRRNGETIYRREVPIAEWTEDTHEALSKHFQRKQTEDENQGWGMFDNQLAHGYNVYFTNIDNIPGFEPLEYDAVMPALFDALLSIRPPDDGDGVDRFKPVRLSASWGRKIEDTGEEDKGKWDFIAEHERETDVRNVELRAIEEQYRVEPIEKGFWRSQYGPGLIIHIPTEELAIRFFESLGYVRHRKRIEGA